MKVNCKQCTKEYSIFPSRLNRSRFCSKACKYLSFKEGFTGDKNPKWKGDNVGYDALHDWVKRKLGKPTKCQHCNLDGLTGKKIQWANKSGKYRRNTADWIRLCTKCHSEYDHKKGRFPEPWNKTNLIGICKRCKTKFKIKPYQLKTKKYCSLSCYKIIRKNGNRRKV